MPPTYIVLLLTVQVALAQPEPTGQADSQVDPQADLLEQSTPAVQLGPVLVVAEVEEEELVNEQIEDAPDRSEQDEDQLSQSSQAAAARAQERNASWSFEARQSLPDPLAVGLALQAADLQLSASSMLFGDVIWESSARGRVDKYGTVGWMGLSGRTVIDPTQKQARDGMLSCAQLSGKDPVPGGRELHTIRNRDSVRTERSAETYLILASGQDAEHVFADLKPGETLQITEAEDLRRGTRHERMELITDRGELVLSRIHDEKTQACYASISRQVLPTEPPAGSPSDSPAEEPQEAPQLPPEDEVLAGEDPEVFPGDPGLEAIR